MPINLDAKTEFSLYKVRTIRTRGHLPPERAAFAAGQMVLKV